MPDEPTYFHLTIQVPLAQREIVEMELWEHGASGLEERDATTIVRGVDSESVTLIASFSNRAQAEAALATSRALYPATLDAIANQNWAVEWRRGFASRRIGQRLVLKPSWEDVATSEKDAVVTVDPDNAFGSGDHESTRLVLQALEERVAGGETVLDVGCGTGILAIAALKLGATHAVATDIDETAMVVAERTAASNGVSAMFETTRLPLAEIGGVFDLVLANIQAHTLVQIAADLRARVKPRGLLMLSGILREERERVVAAYPDFELVDALHENDWSAFVLRREDA